MQIPRLRSSPARRARAALRDPGRLRVARAAARRTAGPHRRPAATPCRVTLRLCGPPPVRAPRERIVLDTQLAVRHSACAGPAPRRQQGPWSAPSAGRQPTGNKARVAGDWQQGPRAAPTAGWQPLDILSGYPGAVGADRGPAAARRHRPPAPHRYPEAALARHGAGQGRAA